MESNDVDNIQESNGNHLFAAMSRRRLSCPQILQYLWDAVKIARYQRQFPTKERLFKYIQKSYTIPTDELNKQLEHSARDDLLDITLKPIIDKKTVNSSEQDDQNDSSGEVIILEGFNFPRDYENVVPESHDWYCFECHQGGDVLSCSLCHRVFHCSCITLNESENEGSKKFVCKICKDIEIENKSNLLSSISKRRLNRLLEYLTLKLREKFPDNVRERTFEEPAIVPPTFVPHRRASNVVKKEPTDLTFRHLLVQDCEWRVKKLIHTYVDLNTIYENTKVKKYKHLEEFRADVLTLIHNVVVYHGSLSTMAVKAREMLRECKLGIDDIKSCHFCFKHGNEKVKRYWFCKPCTPPHALVYAKQDEPPFWWPAKVFKKDKSSWDVWFFGDHNRAWVNSKDTKSITEDISSLVTKRTAAFNRALKELQEHQFLLDELSSVTNNFSIAYTDSSSSEEDDEVLEDEKKSLLRLKLAPMLKNINKNRSKNTSSNNSPKFFSENSSTSFSSKMDEATCNKKSPEEKEEPKTEKDENKSIIGADLECEDNLKKSFKRTTNKRNKTLKKKRSNNKLEYEDVDEGKLSEHDSDTPLGVLNSSILKNHDRFSESTKKSPTTGENSVDKSTNNNNMRITRKRNFLRSSSEDKVQQNLCSSKLEKIVKCLESKAEKKDESQSVNCDVEDSDASELPLDLRLLMQNKSSMKRALRDSSDNKKVPKPTTVPPLTIVLNNDKEKKLKPDTNNRSEFTSEYGDVTSKTVDIIERLDSTYPELESQAIKPFNNKLKIVSKKELKSDIKNNADDDGDDEKEELEVELRKSRVLGRKSTFNLRRNQLKDNDKPNTDDEEDEVGIVGKRTRLLSRRATLKSRRNNENDKKFNKEDPVEDYVEPERKKSVLVRKALLNLKAKFQTEDCMNKNIRENENSKETDSEQDSDHIIQEGENKNKVENESLKKKTRVLRKTMIRTKSNTKYSNDESIDTNVDANLTENTADEEQDFDTKKENKTNLKMNDHTMESNENISDNTTDEQECDKKMASKPCARSVRLKIPKDDIGIQGVQSHEEEHKGFTNFSVLKKFRTSPRKIKPLTSSTEASSCFPTITLEEKIEDTIQNGSKISLKRGRPKKVNSTTNVASSDESVSDYCNKIDIVNNNDTIITTNFNNIEITGNDVKSVIDSETSESVSKHKHFVKNIPKKRKTIKNMPISTDSDKDSPKHNAPGEELNGCIKIINDEDSNSSSSHDVIIEATHDNRRTISTQTKLKGKGGNNPFGCSKEWLEVIKQEFHHEKLREIEKLTEKHKKEMQTTVEIYEQLMKDNKRKQWCFHCGLEAIYHCCWNTAYCSIPCQQIHWTLEHRHFCRRRPR